MADKNMDYTGARQIHRAAKSGNRVRLRGIIVDAGNGYSGSYSNRWIRFDLGSGIHIRLTCTNTGQLAHMTRGEGADFAVTLTGMVDLTENLYYGSRVRLLGNFRPNRSRINRRN